MENKVLACPICFKIAINPVLTKCCQQIFCKACTQALDRCPLCKKREYSPTPSELARRMIEQIEVKCPHSGCSVRTHPSEMEIHSETCEFRIRECPICKQFKPSLLELMAHLCASHSQSLLQMLQEKYDAQESSKIQTPTIVKEEIRKEGEDLIGPRKNEAARTSKLGQNGKFYCGYYSKHMGWKEGQCSEKSRLNCPSCMKLDIDVRKLPKNHFVNGAGIICHLRDGKLYCGRTIATVINQERTCGPMKGSSCKDCLVLCQNVARYNKIWAPPREWDDD